MTEIMSLQMGSCGNKVGLSFWEKILREHGIEPDGNYRGDSDLELEKITTYFSETKDFKFLPRAVFMDLEPGLIDSITANSYGQLLGPNAVAFAQTSAGNNWAKGYYTEGAEWVEYALDIIRKQAEGCDKLQGFHMIHALGGGTGSGMGSLLTERIKQEYPDCLMQTFSVFPSPKVSDVVVEPYNALLSLHPLMENPPVIQVVDNEALYDICFRRLKLSTPTYGDLNHLASDTMSSLTCTYRFPGYGTGKLNSDIRSMATNLVPFPRANFLISSFSRFHSRGSCFRSPANEEIINEIFDTRSLICSLDPRHGRTIAATAVLRGRVTNNDHTRIFQVAKKSSYFANWLPDNLKACSREIPPKGHRNAGVMTSNSTAIQEILKRILEQYTCLYRRKAFLHWYTSEGMDPLEFIEAESNLNDLISEYQRLQDFDTTEEELEDLE